MQKSHASLTYYSIRFIGYQDDFHVRFVLSLSFMQFFLITFLNRTYQKRLRIFYRAPCLTAMSIVVTLYIMCIYICIYIYIPERKSLVYIYMQKPIDICAFTC